MPAAEIVFRQAFPAQGFGVVKGRLLKISRGQCAETVEHRQVGHRTDLSVLGGQRAQAPMPQGLSDGLDPLWIAYTDLIMAAQGNGLQVF